VPGDYVSEERARQLACKRLELIEAIDIVVIQLLDRHADFGFTCRLAGFSSSRFTNGMFVGWRWVLVVSKGPQELLITAICCCCLDRSDRWRSRWAARRFMAPVSRLEPHARERLYGSWFEEGEVDAAEDAPVNGLEETALDVGVHRSLGNFEELSGLNDPPITSRGSMTSRRSNPAVLKPCRSRLCSRAQLSMLSPLEQLGYFDTECVSNTRCCGRFLD
jgi:hypothetical protein